MLFLLPWLLGIERFQADFILPHRPYQNPGFYHLSPNLGEIWTILARPLARLKMYDFDSIFSYGSVQIFEDPRTFLIESNNDLGFSWFFPFMETYNILVFWILQPFTFYKGILVIHMFYIFSESDTYMHIRICLGQFLKTNFSLHFLNIFEFLAKIALRELFYRFCAWERKEASFQQHWNDWKVGWAQNANQILQIRTLNFEEETLLLMKNTNDYFNLWRSQKR